MVTSRKTLRAAVSLGMVTIFLVVAFAPLALAQDENDEKDEKAEKFFANIGGGGVRFIELTISRWSTPSQRARLIGALHSEGQAAMMKILEKQPKVGSIRVQGGRYANTPCTMRMRGRRKTENGTSWS